MPDLFTHFVAARVPGAFMPDRRVQALFIVGTFLPDLVSKGLYWVTWSPVNFMAPSHSIVPAALFCYAGALLLEQRWRERAFAALYGGSLLHIAVDLIKDNLGSGSAYLLYPFSTVGTEFAWIDPENFVLLIPIDAAILALVWLYERKKAVQVHVQQ